MSLPSSLRLKSKPQENPMQQGMAQELPAYQNVEQKKLPSSLRPKTSQNQEFPSFPEEQENDLEREIERNQAQFTSRMLERTLGLPGDIASVLPKWATGFFDLPTSEELKQKSEKLSQGYTQAKNPLEEKVGELSGDIASYSVSGPAKTMWGTVVKNVGVPILGSLAEEGVEKLGGSKSFQKQAKLGTMLLADLWSLKKNVLKGGVKNFGYEKLNEARSSIKKGSIADVSVLEKKLNTLDAALKSGVTGAHTSEAERVIAEIKGHIQSGKMEADKFPKIREDINKIIDNMKGFSFTGPPKNVRKALVKNLNDVKSAVIQAGNRWGRGNNPEFYKAWKEGNEALSVFYKSRELSSFLSKHAKVKNPIIKTMLGMEAYHNPLGAAALAGGKFAIEQGVKASIALPYRFMKSKVIRDLYLKVVNEGLKGNGQNVSRLSQKLDKLADKEEEKINKNQRVSSSS